MVVGESEREPKLTVAPCATFWASIRSGKDAPPTGATNGEKTSNCGAPVTLLDWDITAKATGLETSEALATETVIVPAAATSCAGTGTASVVQLAPLRQFAEVADDGARITLPNFTCEAIPRPVPVIVSVKLPLPAGTFVGEMERMFGWTACCGGGGNTEVAPPQPENRRTEPRKVQRRIAPFDIGHHPAPTSGGSSAGETAPEGKNSARQVG